MTVTVIGIDLAAQPSNTGVVRLDADGPGSWTVDVEHRRGTDDLLVELGSTASLVGVDAPLGWPSDFVEAVAAHHAMAPWTGTEDRRSLTHRCTDDVVVELGWGRPMSASADKLGSVAMRAALLQRRWAERWGAPAARDGSGRLAEVYPAAALRAWGIDSAGYKAGGERSKAATTRRAQIVDTLATACADWVDLEPAAQACVDSDHVLDALLAALVAVALRCGATLTPRSDRERRLANVEGWIHVPSVPLAELDPSRAVPS